jgi:hypothetical protein
MAAGGGGPRAGRNRRAARRSEEQVEVMHALWAEPHVTFRSGGSPEPSLGRKLFRLAQASSNVPSTEKCSDAEDVVAGFTPKEDACAWRRMVNSRS